MSLEEFCSKWIADVPGKERQFVNDASGMVADEAVEIVKLGLITRAVGHGCELSDGDMEGAGMAPPGTSTAPRALAADLT